MLYVDKLLAQLVYPLGLALGLAVVALVLRLIGRRRTALALSLFAASWLWVWSMPIVSNQIRRSLESQSPAQAAEQLPEADVIVLLGGGVSPAPPGWPYPDLNHAADRVWHAARLFHAGKAPRIVVSGGVPLGRSRPKAPGAGQELAEIAEQSEAEAMRVFLVDLGVPDEAILLESKSQNTRENAILTAQLLEMEQLDSVLLVTSALHMPRSLATFRAAGIEATPAATDFEIRPSPHAASFDLRNFLPDSGALFASSRAIKEYLGLWVYRWRGWAK